jgi:broad specificity phosphatase PhoE
MTGDGPVRTTVHLLRHGEVHNPAQVLYGRLEGYRLSERGQAMAARVAEDLSRGDVVAVVSSPLQRAQETAAPLARMLGVEVSTDDRLIESENVFEGIAIGTRGGSLRNPVYWRHLWNPFRPSWGEPYRHIAERMLAAVTDARDAARGHEVVCVSHQLPIWTARNAATGRRMWHDPRVRECALASLTSFRFDDDRLVGVGYREPAAGV